MFIKRPLILILVLIGTTLACNTLFPDLPNNTVPDAVRDDGECKDQRFKDAELAAFQTMLQERKAATDAFDQQITEIEKNYKERLLKQRTDYNNTLNACKDATCSQNAKTDYDTYIEREQVSHEAQIQIAEDAEQTAIEQAQDKYNAAVEEARQLYCIKYKASGTQEEATYLGLICDLEKPFSVEVTSPYYQFTMQFTPSGPLAGSFTYTGTWFGVGPMNGDGTYTVQGAGTAKIQLIATTAHTTSTEAGDVHGTPQYNLDLFPLDTKECSQP